MTVRLHKPQDIVNFCTRHIPGFDPGRYRVVAVRVFAAAELIVTVFAADQLREAATPGNVNVRKFKIQNVTMQSLSNLVESFNFTVSDDGFNLDAMRVTNT